MNCATRVAFNVGIGCWLVLISGLPACCADPPRPAAHRLIEPFDYRGVSLGPGPLKSQVDEVRQFYLAIADDDLLKGFRARAGHPAPGKDLGGWYSSDTFLVFGQIVSGLSRLYAGTHDEQCRDKADRLISEWAKCIEPDGYFYASRKPNAPHYIYDKILWGLLDDYLYCENRAALDSLSRITDWAIKNLERSRRVNDTSTEWYTLSENLYRAYLATGDPKYRDFAAVWEYHDYWDTYARGGDIFAPRPDGSRSGAYHAYSHVNNLGGAGAAYLVTGQSHYLETLLNASHFLQDRQCYATGGFGPDEELLPRDKLLAKLGDTHNTFETQCGSWAVFKLAKYLLAFTGDAQYGDWIERLVINGIGASIPMTDDGRVFYYSDYCLYGGAKFLTDFGWSCCTGTRPQAVADYYDLIYFYDPQNLYVNLFASSSVQWSHGSQRVTLTQTTQFPESDAVHLKLALSAPATFGLNLRVPTWLAAPMEANLNGKKAELEHGSKHWAIVHRTWQDGDELTVRLPMKLWSSAINSGLSPQARTDQLPPRATPTAALFGPVVLAFAAPTAKAMQKLSDASLEQSLKPAPAKPLCFNVSSNPEVQARPFYSFGPGDRYFMYLSSKITARIPHSEVKFTGMWNQGGAFRYSNEVGATAECAFEGTGVRWLGRRFDDGGLAEITIDGKAIGRMDQYGPGRDLPFDWRHTGLAPGRHTIQLRLLPDKPENSKDRFLNVIGFQALSDND
jgi:DUF1680 family protein